MGIEKTGAPIVPVPNAHFNRVELLGGEDSKTHFVVGRSVLLELFDIFLALEWKSDPKKDLTRGFMSTTLDIDNLSDLDQALFLVTVGVSGMLASLAFGDIMDTIKPYYNKKEINDKNVLEKLSKCWTLNLSWHIKQYFNWVETMIQGIPKKDRSDIYQIETTIVSFRNMVSLYENKSQGEVLKTTNVSVLHVPLRDTMHGSFDNFTIAKRHLSTIGYKSKEMFDWYSEDNTFLKDIHHLIDYKFEKKKK